MGLRAGSGLVPPPSTDLVSVTAASVHDLSTRRLFLRLSVTGVPISHGSLWNPIPGREDLREKKKGQERSSFTVQRARGRPVLCKV